MRFPRQAKIFRGQLDAAPVAGVLFLVLIFIQIGSLLYTPGVLVQLQNPGATIRIAKDGLVHFGTNFFTGAQTNELRAALQNSTAGPPFDLQVDPAAPPVAAARARDAVNQILVILQNPAATIRIAKDGRIQFGTNFFTEAQTNELRVALQNSTAGPPFYLLADPAAPPAAAARARNAVNQIFLIHVPASGKTLIGTDNPTVMVRVNFLGQYIYDNHVVGEEELKAELTKARQTAARESRELTLTIAGDEQVKWDALTRLAQWAREVGIKDTILAEWMDKPAASAEKPVP